MRKLATLTKMTAKGMSTWTFAQCDGVYLAFGGTTNRYDLERHTAKRRWDQPTPKPVKLAASIQQELPLDENIEAPRPTEHTLVELY